MSIAGLPSRRGGASQGEDWDESEFFGFGMALLEETSPTRLNRYEEDNREAPRRRTERRFEERARVFGQARPDEE